MDFLKSQFDRIQQQVSALTPSQKMLTGTLVTIMVMTLLWWGRYAGTAEMEPVLDQSLSQDEAGRIATELARQHIEYKNSGDKILVPTDRKLDALAVLSYNSALPKDTATGFDEIIKQLSPWDGTDRQNVMFNHGKELTLSRIIGSFPDVATAAVIIDPHSNHYIANNIESTAMVSITMKAGAKPGDQMVKAAASMVAGAQSGLSMRNIKVVVNGMAQKVSDGTMEDGTSDVEALHSLRDKEEIRLARKVSDLLNDIQGVLVSVTVSVNDKATVSDSTKVDQKNSLHMELRTESETHEHTSPTQAPGDTGVKPNAGLDLAAAPAAAATESASSETKEKTDFQNLPAVTHEQTKSGPGGTTPVSAAVRIPHGYFVAFLKSQSNGKQPDEKTVKETIEAERAKTTRLVMGAIGLTDPSAVSVEVYPDPMPVVSSAPAVTAASAVTLALGGHVKEIVLGGLALVSLFMVSSMVKKAGPALPAVVAPAAPPLANRLDNGETIAGEVGEGGNLLSGIELDEEAVRNQQMMEQVSTLVDENPDTAATLVKRWLSQA